MKVISYQNEFTRRNQSLVVMRTPTHPLSSQLCTGAAVISYCLTAVFQYQKDIRALHPSSNVSLPPDQLSAQSAPSRHQRRLSWPSCGDLGRDNRRNTASVHWKDWGSTCSEWDCMQWSGVFIWVFLNWLFYLNQLQKVCFSSLFVAVKKCHIKVILLMVSLCLKRRWVGHQHSCL